MDTRTATCTRTACVWAGNEVLVAGREMARWALARRRRPLVAPRTVHFLRCSLVWGRAVWCVRWQRMSYEHSSPVTTKGTAGVVARLNLRFIQPSIPTYSSTMSNKVRSILSFKKKTSNKAFIRLQ
ncbi:hypothetical protein BRADI_2g18125v3 [Brachypodium distachyon]|uniref:Uncharacterized protein n=1 Tax=Brachypodium distachyon TaxID=15368 RepID=A0A2K2D935_BRADI|nr:hypothetical protein BRADI_2g18125v3 [Brachypodium distachyon]